MKKELSSQQLEVMKILWNSENPLVASDIVKLTWISSETTPLLP